MLSKRGGLYRGEVIYCHIPLLHVRGKGTWGLQRYPSVVFAEVVLKRELAAFFKQERKAFAERIHSLRIQQIFAQGKVFVENSICFLFRMIQQNHKSHFNQVFNLPVNMGFLHYVFLLKTKGAHERLD